MGGETTAAAAFAQVVALGVLAWALAMTLPSIPTRLTVYPLPVNGLISTPYTPAAGAGEGDPDAPAEGVADRAADAADCEGLAPPVPGTLQAAARITASTPSAEACRRVDINKRQRHDTHRVTFPVPSST